MFPIRVWLYITWTITDKSVVKSSDKMNSQNNEVASA